MNKKIAVFMDRDGTVNEEVGYLSRLDQLAFIPETPEAIRLINASGLMARCHHQPIGRCPRLFRRGLH